MDKEIKNKLIMLLGGAGIIGVVYLLFKYIFPILAPFIIAFLIAYAIEKPVRRMSKRFHGSKIIASSMIMVGIALIIAVLIGTIGYRVFLEAKSFISKYDYYMNVANEKIGDVCDNMDSMMGFECGQTLEFFNQNMDGFIKKLQIDLIPKIMDGSIPMVIKVVTIFAVFFIVLISVVYISKDYEKIRGWRDRSMFSSEVKAITNKLDALIKIYFKVQGIIMSCTGVICVLGLFIIKNPYAIVLGIIIGILDALPLFGTGTVLIPWSISMIFLGRYFEASVLFTIYILTYLLREFMESKYMGDCLGIAPFTMLIIIYMGLILYGILGFILGPVSYVIIKTMILYLKTQLERGKLNRIE